MADTNTFTPVEQPKKKSAPIAMIFTTVILAAALIFLVVMYFDQKNKMVDMETVLTQEKDSLQNELRLMVHGYDTLKTDNDTLMSNLQREKKRIQQLLSLNASNVQLVKKYKAEIGTMREIMKGYIVQIDSLNTLNQQLVAENTGIKKQINEVQNTNVELSKAKEELTSKVTVAAVIQAKDINAVTLNKKRKETTRIANIDKLRICFTLRENPIAAPGEKEVFMRVIRPDSLVITTSPDNLFDFNGNKLVYSASRLVDYMNQDIEMCIFLDNTGDFIVGTYSVELYLENNIIGRTTFALAKR
jgi:FtsZ-binding cell division protein ZapB